MLMLHLQEMIATYKRKEKKSKKALNLPWGATSLKSPSSNITLKFFNLIEK